ncbi:rhodanese-like protein [Prevotella sp. DNF00663]|uniref:rhodanese-like domain-containing protein n=1 Tax=Prevotella sp. DNF00663 TaxID=1384078 RepID=UPI0007811CC3|nr:rhodanese-like domain-containing protein [Prevotella sp. DNF00663]KXB85678.1 rhodanese-like protein [Prevotella sp. DNF00663]
MKCKLIKMLTALLGLTGAACVQKNIPANAIVTVDAVSFEKALSDVNAQIIDVRTSEEFAEGHIEKALNIDVTQSDFIEKAKKQLDKSKTSYVYCRSGRRSMMSADLLSKEGFKVVNLRGGYLEWQSYKDK